MEKNKQEGSSKPGLRKVRGGEEEGSNDDGQRATRKRD